MCTKSLRNARRTGMNSLERFSHKRKLKIFTISGVGHVNSGDVHERSEVVAPDAFLYAGMG